MHVDTADAEQFCQPRIAALGVHEMQMHDLGPMLAKQPDDIANWTIANPSAAFHRRNSILGPSRYRRTSSDGRLANTSTLRQPKRSSCAESSRPYVSMPATDTAWWSKIETTVFVEAAIDQLRVISSPVSETPKSTNLAILPGGILPVPCGFARPLLGLWQASTCSRRRRPPGASRRRDSRLRAGEWPGPPAGSCPRRVVGLAPNCGGCSRRGRPTAHAPAPHRWRRRARRARPAGRGGGCRSRARPARSP